MASDELRSKLNARRELKALAEMTQRLHGLLTGRSPAEGQIPDQLAVRVQRFWDTDTEPDATLTDQADELRLAEWTEAQLADHGVTGTCYVATHLEIDPWLECAAIAGWTARVRAAVPEPQIYLAANMRTVVAFIELEYCHAAFAAVL